MKKKGTRDEVWRGEAKRTAGGLTKMDLFEHPKSKKIVSKKRSELAKKTFQSKLAKHKYKAKNKV